MLNRREYEQFKRLKVDDNKFFKVEGNILKANDRIMERRLHRPKLYIKRNYLGLPEAVKVSNITGLSAKYNKIKYDLNLTPKRLVICARRYVRREVLFAKKKAGKGISNRKKKIFNNNSRIKC